MGHEYSLEDILNILKCLRDPDFGCPWDKKQTVFDILPLTLEESYEVVDAIQSNNILDITEELGDLLLQILFYCQLYNEEDKFSFSDVVNGLGKKLMLRHPHIFPAGTLESFGVKEQKTLSQVNEIWEKVKQKEKKRKKTNSFFSNIPNSLPSAMKAQKVSALASITGFDWTNRVDVRNQITNELRELDGAVLDGNIKQIEEELGDCFFSLVQLARHYELDAELAFQNSTKKFMNRIEKAILISKKSGFVISDLSNEQRDQLWREAKDLIDSEK